MGVRRNFRKVAQAQKRAPIVTKKSPHIEKKVAERSHMEKKAPHEEKKSSNKSFK